jgi:hypothetical protein
MVLKAPARQRVRRLRGRGDRDGPRQPLVYQAIKMIFVQMREHHHVQGRQIFQVHGRFGEPLGAKPIPQVDILTAMQEIRIR